MSWRLGQVRDRLANSFALRLTLVVIWITAVTLGLYVGLGMSRGWAHLLTTATTLPLVLYFELVLARTDVRTLRTAADAVQAPSTEGGVRGFGAGMLRSASFGGRGYPRACWRRARVCSSPGRPG
jgi:hypothetical protein